MDMINRDRPWNFMRTLAAALLGASLWVGGAHAQSVDSPQDLWQLIVSGDALGAGWTVTKQGKDNTIVINRPLVSPVDGYGAELSNGSMDVTVYLYEYADRATTVASFNTDKQD